MSNAVSEMNRLAAHPSPGRKLNITLSRDVVPPGPGYSLLIGFHFGAGKPEDHPAIVSPGLDPIGRTELYECWWYKGDIQLMQVGDVRIAECDDFAVTVLQQPDATPGEFRQCTYDAYRELLHAMGTTQHRHLVRVWNYFGDINEGEGDAEKYRQFSIGRADAFDELGVFDEAVPTGTAIGTVRKSGLAIIALSSGNEFQAVENPRQVSAFRYPRQYGPKSPRFSRGGRVSVGRDSLFLISGTAAIVGHESAHPYDVDLQTGETLQNLDRLCKAISALNSDDRQLILDKECVLRVYLRDASHADIVKRELHALLGDTGTNIVFLNANICRRELMVEIDGVRII